MSNLNFIFIFLSILLVVNEIDALSVQEHKDPAMYELLSNTDKYEDAYDQSYRNDIEIEKKARMQWKVRSKLHGNESAIRGLGKAQLNKVLDDNDSRDEKVTNEATLLEINRIMYTGYPVETHEANTIDGYVLTLLRIPLPRYMKTSEDGRRRSRPAVLLLHGLLFSSVCFTYLGPPDALAFTLVEAGFDVWMGSSRGSAFSRNHAKLNLNISSEAAKFFNYSYEDVGLYDIPIMVDYILNFTQRTKVHFVGHSQGSTAFLVVASMKPEISLKVASAHLMTPIGYTQFFPHNELQMIANLTDAMYKLAISKNVYETKDYDPTGRSDATDIRHTGEMEVALNKIIGLLRNEVNFLITRTSLKQLAHFGQNIRDRAFRRWNYGTPEKNTIAYGSRTPPDYDLSKVLVNLTIYYAAFDNLCSERDIIAMSKVLPKCELKRINIKTFLHEDFVTSQDSKKLVYDSIVRSMKEYEKTQAIEGNIMFRAHKDALSSSEVRLIVNVPIITICKLYLWMCTWY